jgi:hypothetical protein
MSIANDEVKTKCCSKSVAMPVVALKKKHQKCSYASSCFEKEKPKV